MLRADASSPKLDQARVLIVEDEPFIAFDLATAVEDAGGVPVGPAATLRQALELAGGDEIRAAILDVDLPDGHIGPVLEMLDKRSVAVVVHTGVGLPPEIKPSFAHVPVYTKPTPSQVLIEHLAARLRP